ncbi:hypothetical protein TREMEDRAFT_71847 [Tremella mesenterica DSM 1558]|uniref:uncharacterized protein n=1 Tax=Tremella mesenterica (strain ATCC 24925 / CBS 8224 / DSM 1558 / NBRC 9311 / NRRL Y-6157 / RJB 2259-6 / UBC 559-6) TaxID=578456 RepID=UPI0003F48CAA|nr:uncharacterized protein TREMEDRAFT_71847 [Tremella mesenterica DSM 1558]EIW68576.1 hypothetical protein TREMEDRAFT_71847 [Tremella mesenterica DSM 1558]
MSTIDISTALSTLQSLSSSPSTSASGPLTVLIDDHLTHAKQRLINGENPSEVVTDLQKNVLKAKKEVDRGLKGWYAALGGVGRAVDKTFPPQLSSMSSAYDDPPLFSSPPAKEALDFVVLDSLGRRGLWDAVEALEEELGIQYDEEKRKLSEEMHKIIEDIERGDVGSALEWCQTNKWFLSSPQHPSALPYHLHKYVFLSLSIPHEALSYAQKNLMIYIPTQPVLQLVTSCLYPHLPSNTSNTSSSIPSLQSVASNPMKTNGVSNTNNHPETPYQSENSPSLVALFRTEFCRRHGWPKEDPLEVVVDLGSRGGALGVIEKARRLMGDHLGGVRTWTELPMQVPLPPSRRYHSIFVCPVSKEQASEMNPPTMLSCGHVIAEESFNRLLKSGRRPAKCPYCPTETSQAAAQRLYF